MGVVGSGPASSFVAGADPAHSLSPHGEARRLLTELPEHLADMATFSLATGLRAANVTGLQWQQVDLTRQLAWIHPDQAKARKAIPVPLNGEAMALVRKQVGKHRTYVFRFRGRRVNRL